MPSHKSRIILEDYGDHNFGVFIDGKSHMGLTRKEARKKTLKWLRERR